MNQGSNTVSDAAKTSAQTEIVTEILFIDDESPILSALKRLFHGKPNMVCHFANSPMEAMEILSQHQINVIVSDYRMPQMSGTDLLAKMKEKRPKAVRMMITGNADLTAVQKAINEGEIFRFILKPWDDEELVQAVSQAVEYYHRKSDAEHRSEATRRQNVTLGQINAKLEEQVTSRTRQLADALHTARSLTQKMDETLYHSTKMLFGLIKFLSPEIGSHSQRVAEHAVNIGRRMNCTMQELRELEIAALLHDIGMLYLPELWKRNLDEYSAEEKETYHRHPIVARELLGPVPHFARVGELIAGHHERYDGTGFPTGKSKSELPIECYIIGIADLYDHFMTENGNTNESYEQVHALIEGLTDTQFPAKLVQSALYHFEQMHELANAVETMELGLSELIPNMILVHDVYASSGALVMMAGTMLTPQHISQIRMIHRLDPITGNFPVLRKRPATHPSEVPVKATES
jgi:response regulator RpfG family c-di-GMP phosphodiesterase